MKLKCQCCGIERDFKDEEEAFQEGWDAPPHFTGYVCCDLCPAVCIVLKEGHTHAHALWEKEGRPKDFSVLKCQTDKHWSTEEQRANMDTIIDNLQKKVEAAETPEERVEIVIADLLSWKNSGGRGGRNN